MEVALRVRVDVVGPVREFERQDGSRGRVVNLDISDDTGRCRLVLWDDDVALVERGRVAKGSSLRLLDCFVRVSRFGTEVSRGKFGTVLPGASGFRGSGRRSRAGSSGPSSPGRSRRQRSTYPT